MNTTQKYVRLKQFNEIIIFPEIINHSDFKNFEPISAGFCNVRENSIACFGRSITLNLPSEPIEDSLIATRQVFGYEAKLELKKTFK